MKIWQALETMKQNGPSCPVVGICGNIQDYVSGPSEDVWNENKSKCFSAWDEYSKSPTYPIPGYDEYTVSSSFNRASGYEMWNPEHEYGAARLRLLDHCIEWFKKIETNPS